jgi:hypothetical protein
MNTMCTPIAGVPKLRDDLCGRYEELRREVLTHEAGNSSGLGLGLFIRRGMAAWVRSWSHCSQQGQPASRAESSPILAGNFRGEVARVLAGMVLGCSRGEVRL